MESSPAHSFRERQRLFFYLAVGGRVRARAIRIERAQLVAIHRGWPATNPAIRLLKFDPQSFELLDATTYIADLHTANRLGRLEWKVEYEFKQRFGMTDMSASSFEELASRLLGGADGEDEEEPHRGWL